MSTQNNQTLGSRLKNARLRAGYASATSACEQFGWALSKYRAHENGQNPYKVKDAEDYGRAFGVSAAWLLTGTGGSSDSYLNNSIFPVAKTTYDIQNTTGDIPMIATACVGIWREAILSEGLDPESRANHTAPVDPRFSFEHQFDVKVTGNGFNKYAADGFFLRCVDLSALNADVKDGDFVVVRRQKENLIEVSAKRVKKNGKGIELLNETDDPRLIDQVIFLDHEKDNITILGKILWTYQNLENL